MPSVAWRDEDEETAVRDEVDGVLGRLTRDWAVSRDGARGAGPTGRTDDASAVDLDAVFDDEETQTEGGTAARFLHRCAEDEEVRAVLESPSPPTPRSTSGTCAPRRMPPRAQRRRHARSRALGPGRPSRTSWTASCRPWYAKTYYKVVAVVRGDEQRRNGRGLFGLSSNARIRRRRRIRRRVGRRQIPRKRTRLVRLRVRRRHGVRAGHHRVPPVAAGPQTRPVRLEDHRGRCLRRDLFPERSALLHFPRAVARAQRRGTRTERTTPCSTARSSRSRACTWTRSCPTPPPGALGIQARHRVS